MSKSSKRLVIVFLIFLIIIGIILPFALVPKKLTRILPEISGLEQQNVNNIEIFITVDSVTRYSSITNKKDIADLVKLINGCRVWYKPNQSFLNDHVLVVFKMQDETQKKINFKGSNIAGTKYYSVTPLGKLFSVHSDTDIDFVSNSSMDEYFVSTEQDISIINSKKGFDTYIDDLNYQQNILVLKQESLAENERQYYKTKYKEDFFTEKSIIMVNYAIKEGERNIAVDSLHISKNTLNIYIVKGYTAANNSNNKEKTKKLIMLVVNKKDLTMIENLTIQDKIAPNL